MKITDLYSMSDFYNCKTNDEALELLKQLRVKVGHTISRYTKSREISNRQQAVSESAVRYALIKEYKDVLRETYDFLDDYNKAKDKSELSNQEFAVLNVILTMVLED